MGAKLVKNVTATSRVESTDEMIQRSTDVHATDRYGNTPLHWASRNNSKETATELIQRGADVNAVNKDGDTPLHWASRNKETAAELIQRGADVNSVNKDGDTPLHWASRDNSNETAVELMQHGADANAANKDGDTPLHWNSRNNSKKTAAELIQRGANVNAVNKDYDTPLHRASWNNSKETAAELIQRGADVNAANKDGDTPLHLALKNNGKETAAKLIQSKVNVNAVNQKGDTPLHWASRDNSKETAVELIQRGAYVNALDKEGDTPLHWASWNNSKKTATELIRHGAYVNAVNKYGNTPLHRASWNKSKETATELIKRGADVNVKNTDGHTPLHWASWDNSKETATELIQRGANINAVNKEGDTPLHWASRNNSEETAVELIQCGADVSVVNEDGDTPLHWNSRNNSKATATKLIQRGAHINAVNKDGDTPLHWATRNNSKETAAKLIQHGADVNAVNKDGDTPLHWATMYNSKEIAVKLLNFNADIFIKNKFGVIPLINAFDQTDREIFFIICQKIQCKPLTLNCNGEPFFHAAAKFCFSEILNIPDSSGCSRELVLKTRHSPLHFWATAHFDCGQRIKEFGERLIKMGAQVSSRNDEDQAPLHVANTWAAVDLLLKYDAWPNVKLEPHGDTPLLTRAKRIERSSPNFYDGFRPDKRTGCTENDLIHEWEKISENGMDPWITNNNGESVMKLLIDRNNFLLANALVSFEMKELAADSKHTNGDTILHIICAETKDELQTTIDKLLKYGVKVNCFNTKKQTPLHLVCKRISNINDDKQSSITTMLYWTASRLLAYGADPTLKDSSGVSCYDIAEGVSELCELLKKPIDVTAIPQLLKWSDPKSKNHRHVIAQVVRNQNSMQVEWFHYHEKPIGSGSFGHVFAGVDSRDGREIAVKRIEKHRLTRQQDRREISNLTIIQDCGEIVRYLCHHEDNNFVFLILDLMEGTLIDYLSSEERDASNNVTFCRDVIKGLSFLHEKEVLHRDIKPGNILYKLYPRSCLKLADFGLSSKPNYNATSNTFSVMHTAAGTRCWMAPKLLRATGGIKHSEASDVFACGLVLHYLLAEKRHAFTNPSSSTSRGSIAEQNETEQALLKCEPFLHKDLTPEAVDLLKRMMVKNESERPKAADTLYHPFFWSEAKGKDFVVAVGNQPEIQRPGGTSPVEQDLENTLGKQREVSIGWENCIPAIYVEMTTSGRGRRFYDTYSAVELLRFVRNCYAHASDQHRTPHVQNLILRDQELFNKFPTMIIDVYRVVVAHGWEKRIEIGNVLKNK